MKIEKYKYLGNGKYKVIINKNDYIIYEDIILKYSLLTKELITEKEYVVPLISHKEQKKLTKLIKAFKESVKDKETIIIKREIKKVKE